MGMQNFDTQFKTPEQYIIDITYQIWEERGVGRIRDWYAEDCPVRSPHGVNYSVEDVIHHTLETMHEFPTREIFADDVIIGDKESGFYSSHRARSLGVHKGEGKFGKPTQRPFMRLAIADCLCRDNKVVEEWLLADQAQIALNLGLDPVAFGKNLGRTRPDAYAIGNEAMRQRWQDENGITFVGDLIIANGIISIYDAVWNRQQLQTMTKVYDRAVRFESAAGTLCYGHSRTADFLTQILASIPDGRFEPHHVIVKQDAEQPTRVAMRWSYGGTHSGHGRYGQPTGCPLTILGISHFELRNGKIMNEWLVMDETAVYAQIAAHSL